VSHNFSNPVDCINKLQANSIDDVN